MIIKTLATYLQITVHIVSVANALKASDGCGAFWCDSGLSPFGFSAAVQSMEFGANVSTLHSQLYSIAQAGLVDDGPLEDTVGDLTFNIPATNQDLPEEGTVLNQDTTPTNFSIFAEAYFIAPENGDYTFSIDNISANAGAAWYIFDDLDMYCCTNLDLQAYLPTTKQAYSIGADPCGSKKSVTVNLLANHTYELVVTYANTRGDAELQLGLEFPSGEKMTELSSYLGLCSTEVKCDSSHQQFFNITKADVPVSTTYSTSFSETEMTVQDFNVYQYYTYYYVYAPLTEPSSSASSSSSVCIVSSSSSSVPISSSSSIPSSSLSASSSFSSMSSELSASDDALPTATSASSSVLLSSNSSTVSSTSSVTTDSAVSSTIDEEGSMSLTTSSDDSSIASTTTASDSVFSTTQNSVVSSALSGIEDLDSGLKPTSTPSEVSTGLVTSKGPQFDNSTTAVASSRTEDTLPLTTVTYIDKLGVTLTTTVPCDYTTMCTQCEEQATAKTTDLALGTTGIAHYDQELTTTTIQNTIKQTGPVVQATQVDTANQGVQDIQHSKTPTAPIVSVAENSALKPATSSLTGLLVTQTENNAGQNSRGSIVAFLCMFSLFLFV
ncbi:hypothetical protein DAKH74_049000 [Maudiozyma humilis]|uniref:PA14 domain-containing protein n=1 Tax=Maudiozyma humilis TaxID=51915 RepID=A0AAV5S470_MAUHU|nr:hypothetical protein DAKH74_049000 [Kazachstania humilis]